MVCQPEVTYTRVQKIGGSLPLKCPPCEVSFSVCNRRDFPPTVRRCTEETKSAQAQKEAKKNERDTATILIGPLILSSKRA